MKNITNKITSLFLISTIGATIISSCNSPAQKLENADANVTEAKEDLEKKKNDFRKWATGMDAREPARPAHTHYEVVAERRDAACVKLMPKTGRTHQIRVHMDAIGHPVVGDKRYAPTRSAILGFTRLALHAQILSIETPNGEQCTFEAPLPDDFLVAKELLATEVV